MTTQMLTRAPHLRGSIDVPGDKSISHRAVLFNALADGEAHVTGFLTGADCLSSVACAQALGATVTRDGTTLRIVGRSLRGLREANDVLDCGNSGTTLRLLAGILAGQPGLFSVLTGDASLRSRPQKRIVLPLRALGAQIDGRDGGDRAPLAIRGTELRDGHYRLPIASAQVKSALLLAALCAGARLTLDGRTDGRDHTERMLAAMGVPISVDGPTITLAPTTPGFPRALSLAVPGDPSSAAFWWVAAAIHPNAEITTRAVCLNPTRTGALDALRLMGADITVTNERTEGSEPVGDVTVRSSQLRGATIGGPIIPRLIDEIPVLAVAAACASGDTVFRDAAELRAKETDRIATVVAGLSAMGVPVEGTNDGMGISGVQELRGAALDSHDDHRLAMAWAVAGSVAAGETQIARADAVDVSYPSFWSTLAALRG